MKIGFIGSGNMAAILASRWAAAGHQFLFSYSRDPQKLEQLAASFGSSALTGTPEQAAQFADVLVLATPWPASADALRSAGDLSGKVVMSIVNALKPDYSGLAVGTTTSGAEELSAIVPTARFVATLPPFAEVLQASNNPFEPERTTVFYCGDDAEAKKPVAQLITDFNADPVDAGPLTAARFVEPAMMLLVDLACAQKMGGQIGFKLLLPNRA